MKKQSSPPPSARMLMLVAMMCLGEAASRRCGLRAGCEVVQRSGDDDTSPLGAAAAAAARWRRLAGSSGDADEGTADSPSSSTSSTRAGLTFNFFYLAPSREAARREAASRRCGLRGGCDHRTSPLKAAAAARRLASEDGAADDETDSGSARSSSSSTSTHSGPPFNFFYLAPLLLFIFPLALCFQECRAHALSDPATPHPFAVRRGGGPVQKSIPNTITEALTGLGLRSNDLQDDVDCPICLDQLVPQPRQQEDEVVPEAVMLPCRHAYHEACIKSWFAAKLKDAKRDRPLTREVASSCMRCPLCKKKVSSSRKRWANRGGNDARSKVQGEESPSRRRRHDHRRVHPGEGAGPGDGVSTAPSRDDGDAVPDAATPDDNDEAAATSRDDGDIAPPDATRPPDDNDETAAASRDVDIATHPQLEEEHVP